MAPDCKKKKKNSPNIIWVETSSYHIFGLYIYYNAGMVHTLLKRNYGSKVLLASNKKNFTDLPSDLYLYTRKIYVYHI